MSEYPLISCIMPTRNRGTFLAQARRLFDAQDYPNRELVTIEDGEECNWEVMAGTNYHHLGGECHSIGYKRNFAYHSHIARGDILCQWDDDDYHGPSRLSKQVEPILEGRADVTALKMSLLLRIRDNTLWRCSESVHKVLFGYDVKCGTLMYRASYMEDGLRYLPISRGEDYHFLHALVRHGARLEPIIDPASYICVRHESNVTADIDGIGPPGWEQVPLEQYIPEQDRAFYASMAGGTHHGSG